MFWFLDLENNWFCFWSKIYFLSQEMFTLLATLLLLAVRRFAALEKSREIIADGVVMVSPRSDKSQHLIICFSHLRWHVIQKFTPWSSFKNSIYLPSPSSTGHQFIIDSIYIEFPELIGSSGVILFYLTISRMISSKLEKAA